MATVYVEGTVTRTFFEGKGAEVTEYFTSRDGKPLSKKYSAWFELPQSFYIGQVGTFSGLLSVVVEDWVNEDGSPKLDQSGKPGRSAKLNINNAKYKEGIESGAPAVQNAVAPASFGGSPYAAGDEPF